MDMAWWRDLVIVLAGASLTLATLLLTVVTLVIAVVSFKRIQKILDSTSATMGHVEEVARLAKEEIAKPMVNIASVVRGISGFITALKEMFSPKDKSGGEPANQT
jgi:ABC-type uncharacterized transport system permease subunit